MKMQILFFKAFEMHSTLKIEVNTQTRRGFLELQELWKRVSASQSSESILPI